MPVRRLAGTYGVGSEDILLDDLDCNGREENLLLCTIDNRAGHNCNHEEDAGVKCGGKRARLDPQYSEHPSPYCCCIAAVCEDDNVRVVIGDENIHYDPEESHPSATTLMTLCLLVVLRFACKDSGRPSVEISGQEKMPP